MTPTLRGRWQTRFFLLGTIGLAISIFFAALFGSPLPIINLFLVMFIGLGWDVIYNWMQTRYWDHDWPAVMQFWSGIFEGIFLFILLIIFDPFGPPPNPFEFGIHYLVVWVTVFFASQSFMRLFFPRWRFRGGRVL